MNLSAIHWKISSRQVFRNSKVHIPSLVASSLWRELPIYICRELQCIHIVLHSACRAVWFVCPTPDRTCQVVWFMSRMLVRTCRAGLCISKTRSVLHSTCRALHRTCGAVLRTCPLPARLSISTTRTAMTRSCRAPRRTCTALVFSCPCSTARCCTDQMKSRYTRP